ncbi:hypothetical protein [Photorhabdus sp. CRCIA-P01]|uniref:hypothetical protein n=1 Tax=Photorhabdus sp. CRCIA-P01 TaxID=2019570 RepID=UPI000E59D2B1|nr:hypothetical protein [Photorhabdus sp. CRCIA-P01]
MLLTEYIDRNFHGNKAEFARHMGVDPQHVNKWINGGWIVVNDILYSPKREIKIGIQLNSQEVLNIAEAIMDSARKEYRAKDFENPLSE